MNSYYHGKGGERIRAYNARYRDKNRSKVNEQIAKIARTVKGKWHRFKAEAKRDGKLEELYITFEDFERFQSQKCHYCESDLPETGRGIDRKDSSIGYTVENCVPCCWTCNNTKGHLITYDEMLNLIAYRKSKSTAGNK